MFTSFIKMEPFRLVQQKNASFNLMASIIMYNISRPKKCNGEAGGRSDTNPEGFRN